MRIALTALCAFVISLLLGKLVIPALIALKAGQSIREVGPKWHNSKQGTPTMGGIIFIGGSLVCVFSGLTGAAAGECCPGSATGWPRSCAPRCGPPTATASR